MRRGLIQIILGSCIIVMVITMGLFIRDVKKEQEEKIYFQVLREQISKEEKVQGDEVQSTSKIKEIVMPSELEKEEYESPYKEVFQQHEDMVAWLKIADTVIDYPVMHTPDKPNYYLTRNLQGEKSVYGMIYLAETCQLDRSDNLILHGHNMKNGQMFGSLKYYKDKSFWEKNQKIKLYTAQDERTYRIFAACCVTASKPTADVFPYYLFTQADESSQYEEYVKNIKKYALYDTEIFEEVEGQLMTLSTCEYSQENGRLIVVAYLEE